MYTIEGTYQEVFDRVVEHLAQQKERAANAGGCRYRLELPSRTLKCAVGCLIPDSVYNPNIEHASVYNLTEYGIQFSQETKILLQELQSAHDRAHTAFQLRESLYLIATKHKLASYKVNLITEWKY